MLEDLPGYYEPITEMRVLMQASGKQFDKLQVDIADQLAQRFVGTASWDLDAWEAEFDVITAPGQPFDQRRAAIRSKIRGFGKFSGELLQRVAFAYDNGTIDASFNPSTSTFTVKFIDTRGIPPNLDDLKRAIEDIIPAHLLVTYAFTYLRWSELDTANLTWSELGAISMDWASLETWNPN